LYCISLNYRKANLEIRQSFSFSEKNKINILKDITNSGSITQAVLLCTCNRTEIYFVGSKDCDIIVLDTLCKYGEIQNKLISKYVMNYYGDNAINHLFKVSSGIDSMVVGEDEILSQTKSAYMFSKNLGFTGYELNMIFQQAFACAKRIKTETVISTTSISVATLVANKVAKFKDNVNVLLIGATGKIGSTVAKNLISHKNVNLTVTLRNHNSNFNFNGENKVGTIPYNSRYDYFNKADCVISATFSPHYTITRYDLEKVNLENSKRLFIDLAVPPDIDKTINGYQNIELINIDHFEDLAKANNELRLSSIEPALGMILEDIDTLKKDMAFHSFLPYLEKIKKSGDNSLEKLIYKMKSEVNSCAFSTFLEVLESMEF
jgi:glutamyl-tRNA reductase